MKNSKIKIYIHIKIKNLRIICISEKILKTKFKGCRSKMGCIDFEIILFLVTATILGLGSLALILDFIFGGK